MDDVKCPNCGSEDVQLDGQVPMYELGRKEPFAFYGGVGFCEECEHEWILP